MSDLDLASLPDQDEFKPSEYHEEEVDDDGNTWSIDGYETDDGCWMADVYCEELNQSASLAWALEQEIDSEQEDPIPPEIMQWLKQMEKELTERGLY